MPCRGAVKLPHMGLQKLRIDTKIRFVSRIEVPEGTAEHFLLSFPIVNRKSMKTFFACLACMTLKVVFQKTYFEAKYSTSERRKASSRWGQERNLALERGKSQRNPGT